MLGEKSAVGFGNMQISIFDEVKVLWQPLDTRSNDNTSSKALS